MVLNIIGVVLLFVFGFPQPTHDEGIGLGLEDATPLPNGKTVAEHDASVRERKRLYLICSNTALVLLLAGFGFQLWATWR
ncbi:MAG: hypothetical protein KIS62_11925 [Ramlibacter sp.]|nr:hypothetical protein [Ramlibacter sp.]